jgi:SPP1 family predicted phage head-tail adaptor
MMDRQGKKTLASEARNYVWIQERVSTTDGDGGFGETWSDTTRCAAAVLPIQARQVFENRSVGVMATHLIKIRGAMSISEQDRIRWGSRYFEVLYVENIQERGVIKICTCKERRDP